MRVLLASVNPPLLNFPPSLSLSLFMSHTHTHKWMALEQGPVIDNSVRETSEAAALQRDGQMKGEREEGLRGD